VIDRGGLDESATREELRRAMGGRNAPTTPGAPAPALSPRASLLPAERWLLALILTGVEGVDDALGELADADLAGLRSAEALRAARALYLRGEAVTPTALSAAVEDEEARRLLNEVAVVGNPTEGVKPLDCVKELKRLPLKARMAEIQRDLPKATGQALEALLQEKLQIGRLMAHL
jgi:hypothetical protein